MEKIEAINDYIKNKKIDIDKVIDEYYGYIYIIVKNAKSVNISDEDMEEIISDVFLALWKNSDKIDTKIAIKPYLAGIAKNILKNKYRETRRDETISDYEDKIIDVISIDILLEEKEQHDIIKEVLKHLKDEEYKVFILFYYEAKKVKDIAKELEISESKVKVILHRVRKEIKKKLKNGGYGYGA